MEKYFPYSILVITGIIRLIPHVSNFSPVYSSVNYSYVTIKNSLVSTLSLVLMLFISDIFTSMIYNDANNKYPLIGWWLLYTYPAHILNGFISKILIKDPNQYINIGVTCLLTSFNFFMLSNFGVFIFESDHTFLNLQKVYSDAIPFYPMSVLSNIVFSVIFFGLHVLLFRSGEGLFNKEYTHVKSPINRAKIDSELLIE